MVWYTENGDSMERMSTNFKLYSCHTFRRTMDECGAQGPAKADRNLQTSFV